MNETVTEMFMERVFEVKYTNRYDGVHIVDMLEYILEPVLSELEELRRVCDEYVR